MKTHESLLNAINYICGTLVILGILSFSFGVYVSDYVVLVGIGVGLVMSATFIFLMGVFLAATEEVVNKGKRSLQ